MRRKVLRRGAHERSCCVTALERESGVSAEKRRDSLVVDCRIWTEMLEKRWAAGSRVQRRMSRVFDKEHELRVGVWKVVLQKRKLGESLV